jgi:hypothetical protein
MLSFQRFWMPRDVIMTHRYSDNVVLTSDPEDIHCDDDLRVPDHVLETHFPCSESQGQTQGQGPSSQDQPQGQHFQSHSSLAVAWTKPATHAERTLTFKRRNNSYSDAIDCADVIRDLEEADGVVTPSPTKEVHFQGLATAPVSHKSTTDNSDDVFVHTNTDDVITVEPVKHEIKRRNSSWIRRAREQVSG